MFFQRKLCAKIKGKRKKKRKEEKNRLRGSCRDMLLHVSVCRDMSLCVETCCYMFLHRLLHVSTLQKVFSLFLNPSVACFYTQHSPRSESVNGEVCVDVCVFVCACVRP